MHLLNFLKIKQNIYQIIKKNVEKVYYLNNQYKMYSSDLQLIISLNLSQHKALTTYRELYKMVLEIHLLK
jgi:hypothetical protein